MKLIIASDIHGSYYYAKKMIERFKEEKADKLILLGDLLYHGPRNDLPKDYNPKKVIELLNENKNYIYCVKGNCEAEVDQMVLQFDCMAEYILLIENDITIFATHGSKYNNQNLPLLKKGDVLLHGHTHIPVLEEKNDYYYINPGSISIPKENSENSYIVYSENKFTLKKVQNGESIKSIVVKEGVK